jgi:uncharacterized protein DUF2130
MNASQQAVPFSDECPWCGSLIPHNKFLEIETKIRREEQNRVSAVTLEIEKRAAQQIQQARAQAIKVAEAQNAKTLAILKAERDAANSRASQLQRSVEVARKAVTVELQRKHEAELLRQRQVLSKERDTEILKAKAEINREREALQKKLKDVERQVQPKTANQIGDGAEIDLFDALREAFPNDDIKRIKKGESGADIMHGILHKGQPCGTILVESKNCQGWQDAYVTKLRADQRDAGADHAILATTVFKSGKKELYTDSDVIVVSPARAVNVIEILRNSMLKMHLLGLSNKERIEKTAKIYKYITSADYSQRMKGADRLAQNILDLDVDETKAHEKIWEKRGRLVRSIQINLRDIDTEISAIVELE